MTDYTKLIEKIEDAERRFGRVEAREISLMIYQNGDLPFL